MDKSLAKHGVRVAFSINWQLDEVLSLLRTHLDPSDYVRHRRLVTEAMHKVGVALIDTATEDFPEIREEIESDIDRYGRVL